jgi:hypothetical protein
VQFWPVYGFERDRFRRAIDRSRKRCAAPGHPGIRVPRQAAEAWACSIESGGDLFGRWDDISDVENFYAADCSEFISLG